MRNVHANLCVFDHLVYCCNNSKNISFIHTIQVQCEVKKKVNKKKYKRKKTTSKERNDRRKQ